MIRLLENAVEVPSVAATLATMIGLGVGIDYALFIVTRHKLQLGEGMELRESIARATATAGGAVVFAGFTVVIALCSLAFAGIPLVSTLGFTAAIAVVVAVCAAATLLPAMLGALGPHIDSLRVPGTRSGAEDTEPHGWRRWARGVAGRPWRSALAALAVLVVLALPIFQLELGQNDLSALPKSTTARQNYDSLTKGFGPGVNGPLLIAAKYQDPEEAQRSLPGLVKAVDAAPDVAAVSEPTVDKAGTVAVFTVISKSAPWADETVDLVEGLRDETIPAAVAGDGRRRLRRRPDRRLHRPGDEDRRKAAADDRDRRRAQLHRPAARLPLAAGAGQGGGDEPALGRRRLRRGDGGLPARLGLLADRPRPLDPDRQLRPPADVRDPLRPLDGLRGLPAHPDARALPRARRREGGGDRGARQHRQGDHLGGGDHGLRLHQLRPQRQPDRQGVRRRPRGGDRDRLDPGPLPARARR